MAIIPYLDIRFWSKLGHFLSNRAEFFMVTLETFIYRMVMRNRDCDALKKYRIFGGNMGVAKGYGPQARPKSWPTGWTFWINSYLS